MIWQPFDYQTYCVDYIEEHPVAGLFLDMGLGKTVITLTALQKLILDDLCVSKALVIAPLRVARSTWPAEARKWDHLREMSVSVIVGDPKTRERALETQALVYVINRENVPWLVERYYDYWDFDTVVIDELSSFKNHQAKRFKALRRVRPFVQRWIGLTGTPTSNGLMDLWAEIGILDGGERLGRFIGRYREAYFTPKSLNPMSGIVYSYAPRPGAEEQIYERIRDITVSMKALDYLHMPDCVSVTHEVELSTAERRVYDMMRKELVVPIPLTDETVVDASSAAVLSGKLLQMANGAVYDVEHRVIEIHRKKLEALEDLIEAANGQSVLIAYWYQHDRDRIKKHLLDVLGHEAREIQTEKDIEDWNAGTIDVALIHPASAGHGLNLQQGGHILIWFGLTWSLEMYQQTNARLWRQGQTETVTIHHIVTKGTIDEDVLQALTDKSVTQERLLEAVKARLI